MGVVQFPTVGTCEIRLLCRPFAIHPDRRFLVNHGRTSISFCNGVWRPPTLPDNIMPHIFITAFEPYDNWPDNASWLALVEFTKSLPEGAKFTTRRYPVDFHEVRERLERDLQEDFDYALHLGQAPGSPRIRLETIGLNIGGHSQHLAELFQPLVPDGPIAYRSTLPLAEWAANLREVGIPATVSYFAGTYLCNAIFYLSLHLAQQKNLRTRSAFLHLPLDLSQSTKATQEMAALPAALSAAALRLIVEELIKLEQRDALALS